MSRADAIVVGAGFGGLGTALSLAERGAKVRVSGDTESNEESDYAESSIHRTGSSEMMARSSSSARLRAMGTEGAEVSGDARVVLRATTKASQSPAQQISGPVTPAGRGTCSLETSGLDASSLRIGSRFTPSPR